MRTSIENSNTSALSSILKGEFITEKGMKRLIPFLFMLVILGLINIRSSFYAEKLLKQSISLEKEIAAIRLTYISSKSELMSLYRRSAVEGLVEDQYLKTSLIPPYILEKP
jgi:hypothetical protein